MNPTIKKTNRIRPIIGDTTMTLNQFLRLFLVAICLLIMIANVFEDHDRTVRFLTIVPFVAYAVIEILNLNMI